MKITIKEEGPVLDLTSHPGIIILDRWRGVLYWDRAGMVRRIPKAVLADAAMRMWDRLNAPSRWVVAAAPIVVEWDRLSLSAD